MRQDGRPSVVAVATAIASPIGSPADRAISSHLDSWVIGSGSTDASFTPSVCSVKTGSAVVARNGTGRPCAAYLPGEAAKGPSEGRRGAMSERSTCSMSRADTVPTSRPLSNTNAQ